MTKRTLKYISYVLWVAALVSCVYGLFKMARG